MNGSGLGTLLRELRRSRITQAAAIVALFYLLLGIAGPWLAPHDPLEMVSTPRQAPSAEHWMGTDEVGRDTFSRVLVGARVAITVGFLAIGIGLLVGGAIGIIAGFYGSVVDSVAMRFMDVMLAFPGLLLALAVVTFLGTGLVNTMVAIGIGGIPGYARLVRGEVLTLRGRDHVTAARAIGASDLRLMMRHILPLTLSSVLVYSTAQLARAILSEAGLSFLGLGVQPPMPSWGAMIASGQRSFLSAPAMGIFPGLAIMGLVFTLNLLGDSLRDAWDPNR
ncbi:MAG: ABC transporter permease [Longimicrobiales bacterium]